MIVCIPNSCEAPSKANIIESFAVAYHLLESSSSPVSKLEGSKGNGAFFGYTHELPIKIIFLVPNLMSSFKIKV